MAKIWKYQLQNTNYQEIEMPEKSKILTALVQNNIPCIWVETGGETSRLVTRKFALIPTGYEIKAISYNYIATLLFNNGQIVQHLYEFLTEKNIQYNTITEEKISEITIHDRIKGVIYGHAIGDVLGLGTEFLSKAQIKLFYPDGYSDFNQMINDRHRSRWQKGEWTDDTDQMLCILESIIENKTVVDTDIAKRFHDWAFSGGKGIGNTVYNVITNPEFIFDPQRVAKQVWIASGRKNAANGAIMRTSVLGIWEFKNLEKLIENTENVAKITHYDPRCVGSCVAVTLAISMFLQNETDCNKILDDVIKQTNLYDTEIENYLKMVRENSLELFKPDEPNAIGYTLKTMGIAFWAMMQNNFKDTLLKIVNEGGDADTNGAVAGALLGAKLGYQAIPKEWTNGLQNKEKLDKLINNLIGLLNL